MYQKYWKFASLVKGGSIKPHWMADKNSFWYAEGDPDNGIDPGTPFEDLPDDWTCPECGAGKEDFEKVE